MKKRDNILDVMKAFGCFLLVLAHGTNIHSNMDKIMRFVGNLAPVIFFGVSGILVSIDKGNARSKILYYIFLFVFGLSYNGLINPDFLIDHSKMQVEFIQMIAIGNIIIILVFKLLKAIQNLDNKVSMEVKYSSQVVNNGMKDNALNDDRKVMKVEYNKELFFIFVILLVISVFGRNIPTSNIKKMMLGPTVFPIIPWLIFFIYGIFFYNLELNKKYIAVVIVFIITFLLAIFKNSIRIIEFSKGSMDLGYIFFSLLFFMGVYFLSKRFIEKTPNYAKIDKYVVYLSNNSLNFMFIHIYIRHILNYFAIPNVIRYILIFIITILIIRFINNFNKVFLNVISSSIYFWITLLMLIFINPIIFKGEMVIFIYFVLGTLFSSNYKLLRRFCL